MNKQDQILTIQKKFDINSILAIGLFEIADKNNLIEDIAKKLKEKPKPFVK